MKNIALVGFMACGKTTIGKFLAKELNFTFIDTDFLAEEMECSSISDIFKERGEGYFRNLEHAALKKAISPSRRVISTGGGILTTQKNIPLLRENAFVVFLDVPFDVLSERASSNDSRPLFRDRDAAFDLWKSRYETYKNTADFIIDTSKDPISVSVKRIANAYKNYIKQNFSPK